MLQEEEKQGDPEPDAVVTSRSVNLFKDERPRPNLISLRNEVTDIGPIEGHKKLQILLQKEEKDGYDEKAMFQKDKEVADAIEILVHNLVKLPEIEAARKMQKL